MESRCCPLSRAITETAIKHWTRGIKVSNDSYHNFKPWANFDTSTSAMDPEQIEESTCYPIDDVDKGLPSYTHAGPPAGPVRELWHVQHPTMSMCQCQMELQQWSNGVGLWLVCRSMLPPNRARAPSLLETHPTVEGMIRQRREKRKKTLCTDACPSSYLGR